MELVGENKEAFQILVPKPDSLGVMRPSYTLLVSPWIDTLSSLSLSFPTCS